MKSKKGGEKILFLYWFVIMTMVVVAFVIAVSMFYSSKLDVRSVEAEVLNDKVADCLIKSGFVEDWIFSRIFPVGEKNKREFESEFFDNCRLNFEDINEFYQDERQYYVEVKVYDFNLCENSNCSNEIVAPFRVGNFDIALGCELQEQTEDKKLPACFKRRFYAVTKDYRKLVFEILTGIKKVGQNVS